MPKIQRIVAREILDSRGRPTVEAEIAVTGGSVARASVPSGASTGAAEALELRDGDGSRYDGLGVRRAVENIRSIIAPALVGCGASDQQALDARLLELDPTPQKCRLGANAILAVSLVAARAAALARGVPLYAHLAQLLAREAGDGDAAFATSAGKLAIPLPMTNMISGGKHAGGNLDFQDVLVVPSGAEDYPTQLEWIVRVYRRLGKLLASAGYEGTLVGDEGGFGPRLKSNREAVEFVVRAIEAAGLRPGEDVTLALDVAASHFYRDGYYHLAAEQGRRLTSSELVERLESWSSEFPIASIEDALAEDDWSGWQELTRRLGPQMKLVGDDLFATNPVRLARGIELGAANSVLIKVNQIGTLTETFRTILLARTHGYGTVISARSGETEDDFLADLAVGVRGDFIKIGSIARSERLAKYNRLLRIAEH